MPTVQDIFNEIPNRFDANAAAGQNLIFQFDITDGATYHIVIHNGACDVVEGANDDPSVTLIADSITFIGIMTGELDGMQAFMTGKLRTEGNMMLAPKLSEFFKQS